MPKRTKEERVRRLKKARFFEIHALCGNLKQAARLSGMGMTLAYRALQDPDGVTELQRHIAKQSPGDLFVLDHEQRQSLLTKVAISGLMPRVVFDVETGEPTPEILYEPVSHHLRFKCLDMLNKMDGSYVEVKKIVDERTVGDVTPEVRGKLDQVYGASDQTIELEHDEDDDIFDL